VSRPDKPVVSVVRRPWHQLDVIALSDALRQSQLCCPECSTNRSVNKLALLYDSELSSLIDSMVPIATVVVAAVRVLPDKSCALHPLPTPTLKSVIDVLAPFLTELFNRSLTTSCVTAVNFQGCVHLTSPEKGRSGFFWCAILSSNLQSIGSFETTWKTRCSPAPCPSQLKRSATKIPVSQILSLQYRAHHSTESAVLKVLTDILLAVDAWDFSALVLLDLSTAFDTVDHDILLHRLDSFYQIVESVQQWFQSYRSVSRPVVQSLVMSLVLSRLDYGNATLADIPQHLLWRLQSVMNAAAQLIYSSSRFDHITPLLRQLHWLKVKERIDFKLAVLVFKCVNGSAPPYLADELSRLAESLARCRLPSASSSMLVVRRTRLATVGDRSIPVAAIFHSTSSRHLFFKS